MIDVIEDEPQWLPLSSLKEWENTWVWLKVTTLDRSYVYYTPICICRYPKDRVVWNNDNLELQPEIHTIQIINKPNV